MEIAQIRCFVSAAEQRSLTHAAELLYVSQPTLSRMIRALEAELRTTLFKRDGRGVQMTPAGRRFLDLARGILRRSDAAIAAMRASNFEKETITGGLPPSVGRILIPALVAGFAEHFSGAFISLVEAVSDDLHAKLLANHLDFAVLHNPQPTPQLSIERMASEPFYLLGTRTAGPRKDTVGLADLHGLPLIMPSSTRSVRAIVDAALARISVAPNIVMEIDAVGSIFDLIEAGIGYALIPENTIRVAPKSRLFRFQRIDAPELANTICFVTPARPPKTDMQRDAIRLAREIALRKLRPRNHRPEKARPVRRPKTSGSLTAS